MLSDANQTPDTLPDRHADPEQLERLENQLRQARLRLRLAMQPSGAIAAVRLMQTVQEQVHTLKTRAQIRQLRQPRDIRTIEEIALIDCHTPAITSGFNQFYVALSTTRHRPALIELFGEQLFRIAENRRLIEPPEASTDLSREENLLKQMRQFWEDLLVTQESRVIPTQQMELHLEHPDRPTRRDAYQNIADAWIKQNDTLQPMLGALLQCRRQVSDRLGLASFTELGYRRLSRFDCGPAEMIRLKQDVTRYIVPVTQEIRRLQRRRLKLEALSGYDLPCLLPEGHPRPIALGADLIVAAEAVLAGIGGESLLLGRLAETMILETNPEQSPGSTCLMPDRAGRPVILLRLSNTCRDVAALLRGAGLAYAAQRSRQSQELAEYQHLAPDLAEICASALEGLAYSHVEPCFGAGATTYAMVHLTETLLSLPELCLTDELTQRLHDTPDGSAEHLERLWQELAPAYWPDLSSDAVHDHFAVFVWRRQEMLLHNPFTAMSAVIGRLAALDLWCLSRRKPEQAWRQFDKLCTLGSSLPLRQVFTQAGLASPFDTGTIKRLAYAACDYLGL